MRPREAGVLADQIIERAREVFEDHEDWFARLSALAALGYPTGGGSGGGRSKGDHADPTFAAVNRRDEIARELRDHEQQVRTMLELLAKFEHRRQWVRAKGLKPRDPEPVILCEECGRKIEGKDVSRKGLCGRCSRRKYREDAAREREDAA